MVASYYTSGIDVICLCKLSLLLILVLINQNVCVIYAYARKATHLENCLATIATEKKSGGTITRHIHDGKMAATTRFPLNISLAGSVVLYGPVCILHKHPCTLLNLTL